MTQVATKRVIREIDRFRLCHVCSSDERIELVPAELGVSWQECGCRARVRVCYGCKAIASEPCPHGQEMRSELAPKRRSISIPGMPTRRHHGEAHGEPGLLERVLERAKLPRIH